MEVTGALQQNRCNRNCLAFADTGYFGVANYFLAGAICMGRIGRIHRADNYFIPIQEKDNKIGCCRGIDIRDLNHNYLKSNAGA